MNIKSAIHFMLIPILLYFGIEILVRTVYLLIPNINSNFKIIRNLIIVVSYLYVLNRYGLLNIDFKLIDFKRIVVYFLIVIIFIFVFTEKNENNHYELYQIFSAILVSPIIEELICREFILSFFLDKYCILGVIISTFIFVIFHMSFDISTNIYFIIMSLILSFIRIQTRNVSNSIVLHFLTNVLLFLR